MKTAANQQAKTQETSERPTISITRVIEIGPDTASFGGWGPKVSTGNLLKNWN